MSEFRAVRADKVAEIEKGNQLRRASSVSVISGRRRCIDRCRQ